MSQNVLWKDCFATIKVQVTVGTHNLYSEYDNFYRTVDPSATKLILMVHHHKPYLVYQGMWEKGEFGFKHFRVHPFICLKLKKYFQPKYLQKCSTLFHHILCFLMALILTQKKDRKKKEKKRTSRRRAEQTENEREVTMYKRFAIVWPWKVKNPSRKIRNFQWGTHG